MNHGCDELFLLDDVCFPKRKGWTELYVDNPELHLCYHYGDDPVERYGATVSFNSAHGRLLYLNRRVVEMCGGMRTEFGLWGMEHAEYSVRIHQTGLTTNAIQDADGSDCYIQLIDAESCISDEDKRKWMARNCAIYSELIASTAGFIDYREEVKV